VTRGKPSQIGDIRQAQNGYWYTKTDEGQRLTHHIVAETKLGRKLLPTERAIFVDRDRNNLDPKNIHVVKKGSRSIRARIAVIEARVKELLAERERLVQQLKDRGTESPKSSASK
jgi:hypothetical protein